MSQLDTAIQNIAYTIVGGDVGHSIIKVWGDNKHGQFPHALKTMTESEIRMLDESDSKSPLVQSAWKVERLEGRKWVGRWYQVGTRAMRAGAGQVVFGAARYTPAYYGTLSAIGCWYAGAPDGGNIYWAGTHSPEYAEYRDDIRASAKGTWRVTHKGQTKTFKIIDVGLLHEPVAAYRNATIAPTVIDKSSAEPFKCPAWLRKTALVIDIGGLTIGISVAEKTMIDYTAAFSFSGGMLDVIDELWMALRNRYKSQLRTINFADLGKVRHALRTGFYEAGGYGPLACQEEADRARKIVLNQIPAIYERAGGKAAYDGVLLAGGGSVDMQAALIQAIDHPNIALAAMEPDDVIYAAAKGAWKQCTALRLNGRLVVNA